MSVNYLEARGSLQGVSAVVSTFLCKRKVENLQKIPAK